MNVHDLNGVLGAINIYVSAWTWKSCTSWLSFMFILSVLGLSILNFLTCLMIIILSLSCRHFCTVLNLCNDVIFFFPYQFCYCVFLGRSCKSNRKVLCCQNWQFRPKHHRNFRRNLSSCCYFNNGVRVLIRMCGLYRVSQISGRTF